MSTKIDDLKSVVMKLKAFLDDPQPGLMSWQEAIQDMVTEVIAMVPTRSSASPDDIRAAGWSVAVHNDYRQNGLDYTFWLFTNRSGRFVKGEGRTDTEALDTVRKEIRRLIS